MYFTLSLSLKSHQFFVHSFSNEFWWSTQRKQVENSLRIPNNSIHYGSKASTISTVRSTKSWLHIVYTFLVHLYWLPLLHIIITPSSKKGFQQPRKLCNSDGNLSLLFRHQVSVILGEIQAPFFRSDTSGGHCYLLGDYLPTCRKRSHSAQSTKKCWIKFNLSSSSGQIKVLFVKSVKSGSHFVEQFLWDKWLKVKPLCFKSSLICSESTDWNKWNSTIFCTLCWLTFL